MEGWEISGASGHRIEEQKGDWSTKGDEVRVSEPQLVQVEDSESRQPSNWHDVES